MNAPQQVLGLIPYSRTANLVGGVMMALSMSLFVINDSIMSGLQKADNPFGVATLPLPTIISIRGTLVVILLVILTLGLRQQLLPKGMLTNRWNLARALTEVSITFLFLGSLPFLPFAIAQTIVSSNPIFLVFLGVLLFGERVGWRRWLAIFIGFFGIVCASLGMGETQAFDAADFKWWALGGCLLAAMMVAFRDVFTRYVGETLPPISVALTSATMVMIYGWVFSLSGWQTPTVGQLWLLMASGVLIMGAYLCAVFAVRLGAFSVVGPLRFVALVVAFLIGLFFFDEPFSRLGFLGAVLIVGSAVWIVLREARMSKK